MATQSIIVYRNPVEAAFWESNMLFPMIIAIAAALIVAVSISTIFDKVEFLRKYRNTTGLGHFVSGSSIFTVVAVMYFML